MVEFKNVSLTYSNGSNALNNIDLKIEKGEFVFLVGPNGSGKSSILKLIYREILPSSGDVIVDNEDVVFTKKSNIPYLRRKLGIVFQDFRLLPYKTIYENIAYALEVIGKDQAEIKEHVNAVLKLVSLEDKKKRFPKELSSGEQQRISIARALVNDPMLFLADEPTGNLDPKTSIEIIKLLEKINEQGTTMLVTTHDMEIVNELQKRVVIINDGNIIKDEAKSGYHIPSVFFNKIK